MIFNCKKRMKVAQRVYLDLFGFMRKQESEQIGGLEAGVGETRIEVVLTQSEGKDIVAFQLSTWHETLGWQVQKTIPMAAEKICQMQRLLSQTRNHLEERRAPAGAKARVIEFGMRGSGRETSSALTQPATETDDDLVSAVN